MSNNKLDIIRSEENIGGLGILDNGTLPFLVQYDSSGDYTKINIGQLSKKDPDTGEVIKFTNPDRPLSCAEISQKLKRKLWFNGVMKIWDTRSECYRMLNPFNYAGYATNSDSDYTSIISIETSSLTVTKSPIQNVEFKKVDESEIEVRFNECFPEGTLEELSYNINTKTETMVLDNNTRTYELIKPDSNCYQSTIDLNCLLNLSKHENTTAFVRINIKYTKGPDQDLYSINKSFDLFRYMKDDNNNTVLVNDDFTMEINQDITLEYIGGVLRLFPESNEINEYIIDSCTVEYGE